MSKIYFTVDEINPHKYPLPPNVAANIDTLITRLSAIREAFSLPMIVTSGYRSPEDQRRIYANKAKVPMGSQHLVGAAADIADRDKRLARFVLDNIPLLEEVGLWIEDTTRTVNWVHFQLVPPASGSRFFIP